MVLPCETVDGSYSGPVHKAYFQNPFHAEFIMKTSHRFHLYAAGCALFATVALAQDWPQWRGQNRDAKASGFTAPKSWPKELTQKWKTTVGSGDASPIVIGDKVYVFARQEGSEITLCLDAANGKELWQEKYDALPATGPAGQHPGPRSSPAFADGKIVTLGVRGTLSCLDAAKGTKLWRKDDFQGIWPRFYTGSSPIIVGNLCVAQLGGTANGGIVAYDLASGEEKWKWTGDAPAYASPVLLNADGTKLIVAQTEKKMVALGVDGKLLWETPFAPQGNAYNSSTPLVNGSTLIYAGQGRGAKAVQLEKKGDTYGAKEIWSNPDIAIQFSTPVIKNGSLFGFTATGDFFCLNAETGKSAWTSPGTGGRGGYGSIVDAGSVLLALTPKSQLVVFEPTDKQYTELATYKVAEKPTYAYPVVAGKRIFIKDQDSVTLWTLE